MIKKIWHISNVLKAPFPSLNFKLNWYLKYGLQVDLKIWTHIKNHLSRNYLPTPPSFIKITPQVTESWGMYILAASILCSPLLDYILVIAFVKWCGGISNKFNGPASRRKSTSVQNHNSSPAVCPFVDATTTLTQ